MVLIFVKLLKQPKSEPELEDESQVKEPIGGPSLDKLRYP